MDLNSLINKCKKNNRQAQEALYHMYKDALFTLCLKYCRNYEEAEDNLQDSFLVILKNIKKYNGKGSFEGWLKRIAINKAIDRYKKEPFKQEIKDYPSEDEDVKIDLESYQLSLDDLLALIQDLPDQYRLIFNLYELDNYSHKEISEKLSISEGTSKSNLHRAKVLLKKQIVNLKKSSM